MKIEKFQLFQAGYCTADRSHALRHAKRKTIRFIATFAYFHHPTAGHILFDTGYTRRFYDATRKYPNRIYAKITKTFILEKEEAAQQLESIGVSPGEINYIIISHFHADHIGGLKDFPNATFICSKSAFEDVKNRVGFSAVSKGFLPQLLPVNFTERAMLLDLDSAVVYDDILGAIIDLFQDQSIQLFSVDGHAKGQIGARIKTAAATILLIADGAWLSENYKTLHLPHPIVRLFFDDWKNFIDNLQKIHQYHQTYPAHLIIPCHCEDTFRQIQQKQLG